MNAPPPSRAFIPARTITDIIDNMRMLTPRELFERQMGHVIHWEGCTTAEPGIPRTFDPARVTCSACRRACSALDTPRP